MSKVKKTDVKRENNTCYYSGSIEYADTASSMPWLRVKDKCHYSSQSMIVYTKHVPNLIAVLTAYMEDNK